MLNGDVTLDLRWRLQRLQLLKAAPDTFPYEVWLNAGGVMDMVGYLLRQRTTTNMIFVSFSSFENLKAPGLKVKERFWSHERFVEERM